MEERLKVGERVRLVAAQPDGPERLRLTIDGSALEVRVVASSEGSHLVDLGGGQESICTARCAEGTWVWHRGRARLVERAPRERTAPGPGSREAAPAAAARGTGLPAGSITPPMPAQVVAVLVAEGQAVARGEPLVVVSAMKTESQLVSPFAGRVRSVAARVGARVRPGEVLVQVEPEGGRHAG